MKCGKMFKQFEFYVNDQSASQKEQQQFFSFIKSLKSSKRVRFVFRGNSNIIKYYDTDVDNMPLLSHYIFLPVASITPINPPVLSPTATTSIG